MFWIVVTFVTQFIENGFDLITVFRQCRENDVGWFCPIVFLQNKLSQISFHQLGARNLQQILIQIDFGGDHRLGLHNLLGLLLLGKVRDVSRGFFVRFGKVNVPAAFFNVIAKFF